MTEWHLQNQLTPIWMLNGISIGNERLLLAAWEVMTPSWKINDALKGFGQPAIDFLGISAQGDLVAIELKPTVRTKGDAWAVLCQVTASAAALATTFTSDRLESAYKACWSGQHGRTSSTLALPDLGTAVERFFGFTPPVLFGHVQRAVVAQHFGKRWADVHQEFERLDFPSLIATVKGRQRSARPTRPVRRLLSLKSTDLDRVNSGVWWSTVAIT
jgi:hypothetical protein